jgi:U3 small nucleolar RNA-associated protein 4
MSTAVPSYVLVIDLTGEKPRVLRRFDHHRMQDSIVHHNRALKGIQGKKAKINGVHLNGDMDTEMADVGSPQEEENQDTSDEEKDEEEEEDEKLTKAALISVDRLAVSADGQWLATSDSQARTHIFNLDSISVNFLIIHHSLFYSYPIFNSITVHYLPSTDLRKL